jgi:hypothetical protein
MKGEFSVFQFFPDGQYEQYLTRVDAEAALRGALHLSSSVGATLGTTVRVIITDGGDSISWEWIRGKGVVFDGRQSAPDPNSV